MLLGDIFEHILEGIHDPFRKKIIFLAGGPGSGKTFVRSKLIPYGMKVLDLDDIMKKLSLVRKMKLNLKNIDYDRDPELMNLQQDAKRLISIMQRLYREGELGIVVDSTGRDPWKIKRVKEFFENIGYDAYLIVVRVPRDVSWMRNLRRDRTLRRDVFDELHTEVETSLDILAEMFEDGHVLTIINTEPPDSPVWRKYEKIVDRWLRE